MSYLSKKRKYRRTKPRHRGFYAFMVIFFSVTFILSTAYLVNYFYEGYRSDATNSQLTAIAQSQSTAVKNSTPATVPVQNLETLHNQNPDFAGWLSIDGTPVNYPVMKANDNDKYLRTDFYGRADRNGTLFIDYRDTIAPQSQDLTIYGHNMKTTKMFSTLAKYETLAYYKAHPILHYSTLAGKSDYKIFAIAMADANSTNPADLPICVDFNNKGDFINYMNTVLTHNYYKLPVDIKSTDQVITLVTCLYNFDSARMLVFARKVRPGESSLVDVSKATVNANCLMPIAYKK